MKRVVLAEKPSVARDLAQFLKARGRRDGYFEGDECAVTWAIGHLLELAPPDHYDPRFKRWSLDTLPIVPSKFELRPRGDDGTKKQLATIVELFRDADEIVCATDAGREGELIFRYILDHTGVSGKRLLRLWLNSLTEEAIADAFAKLKSAQEYDRLASAARCRSEADWIVGMNGTRYFTTRHRRFDVLWSVGRVQTPVLAMIVGRDDEIRTFVPETFYELATKYRGVVFLHPGKRFGKKEEADQLLDKVRAASLTVRSVTKKKETASPPQLFDLTELQREMNRRHGLSAADTLAIAQELYEAKLLTYPRTDSRYLPNDMKKEMPKLLAQMKAVQPEAIGRLDLGKLQEACKVFDDKKVSDHHAILPTGKSPDSLSPTQRHIFDAVLTRLIAIFYPPCVKEVTTVDAEADGVPFRARGVRIVDPGWTILYPKAPKKDTKAKDKDKADGEEEPESDEQEMPLFEKGETGPHDPFLKEGKTRPPRPFDENTLLGAMETAGKQIEEEELREAMKERGLGTPATRAAIIETLLHRGYIERDKKKLVATDLGRFLIYVIRDEALKSPELTGEWEAKLKAIEQGKLDASTFMAGIVDYSRQIVRGEFTERGPQGLGPCPKCNAPAIQGNRGYGCSRWREGCDFVLWMDYKGVRIGATQAHQLLTRRILLDPVDLPERGPTILVLSARGTLMEIDVPTRERQGKQMPRARAPRPGQQGTKDAAN